MKYLSLILLLTSQLCFAQLNISKLPEATQNEVAILEHKNGPSIKAEILIDNQHLTLDGKRIDKLSLINKRLLRIKLYESGALETFDFKTLDLNDFEKVKIVIHKLGIQYQNEGVQVIKEKINTSGLESINLTNIGASDGNIIDVYYETKNTTGQWKLSKHFPTRKASQIIEYPKVYDVALKREFPELTYGKSEKELQNYKNPNGQSNEYIKVKLNTKLTNITPTDRVLSTFVNHGLDHMSIDYGTPKFGIVNDPEMDMTTYELDSSAGAVVLYDYGRYMRNHSKFMRHIRVKILNKTGLSWGNWVFNTPNQSNFKVYVFNKDKDGEIVRTVADKSTVYKEKIVNGYHVYKVFGPNVKVGSVIDIQYSHPGVPYEWRFQELIPVVHSELEMNGLYDVDFNKSFFGFEPVQTIGDRHWRAKNIPAFYQEPYTNSYSNYITKFEFELAKLYHNDISNSWQTVSNTLRESLAFGGVLRSTGFLKDKVKTIKSQKLTDIEKIHEAYNYIRENIKWNNQNSVFASRNYWANFTENHSGNSAEINLFLISLLNKIGVKTYPVVLSTRDNGLLKSFNASLRKLNYVVAYVKYGDTKMLLDATSEKLTPGILPKKCLNGKGWLVDKDSGKWVHLNPYLKKETKRYIEIKQNKDGYFEASISNTNNQYGYLNWAQNMEEYEDGKTYKAYLMDEFEGVDILKYEIKKNDSENLSSLEIISVDISSHVDDLGDQYIINPHVLTKFSENLFKSDTRRYPVDLNYPIVESTTIVLHVPQGYQASKIPKSIKMTGLENDLIFTFLSQKNDSYVNMSCKIEIKRNVFTEAEYHFVKAFFSAISDKFNDPVNLTKL